MSSGITSAGAVDFIPLPKLGKDERRRIVVQKGKLAEVVDEVQQALIDASANVYVRGGMLVSVVSIASSSVEQKGVWRPIGTPLIVPLTAISLADLINRVVLFLRPNSDDELRAVDCPKEVAETLLSRIGQWRFRMLTAVINAPTLRLDGSILSEAGHDPKTGLLLLGGSDFHPVPESPTRRQATEALTAVEELLGEFPFVSEDDRSAALAMLMTAVIRATLPTAPMFAITAPTPGTGKSYLADLAAVLATGRKAAVVGASCDEEELEKRLGSSLMAGDAVLNLDNIDRPLKSERLCQVLSQEAVKFRILGRSTNIDTATNALVIATGNALRLHDDLTRRAMMIRLNAGEERPELHRFKHDPVKDAVANRSKYIVAALTVLRAFIVGKDRPALSPLGSFEDWSNVVRSALVWLGKTDPVQTMEAARATDPERERTSEVLAALLREGIWTVRDLAQRVTSDFDLRDALAGFMKHGQFDKHGFGNWCRKHRDRPVNGMALVQAGEDAKAKVILWSVKDLRQERVSIPEDRT
jgi:putative DNA primase/helicase